MTSARRVLLHTLKELLKTWRNALSETVEENRAPLRENIAELEHLIKKLESEEQGVL